MKDEIMILPCKDEEQHILNEKPFSRKDAKKGGPSDFYVGL